MSTLALMTAQGFMPVSNTILKTYSAAWKTTQTLAAQSGGSVTNATVLAAQASGGLRGTPTPTMEAFRRSDATYASLAAGVQQACRAGGDGRACSAAAQQLGSYEAAVAGPSGALTQALLNKRDDSSIREWFAPPTRVLPIKVTTPEVGAVAVSLAAMST